MVQLACLFYILDPAYPQYLYILLGTIDCKLHNSFSPQHLNSPLLELCCLIAVSRTESLGDTFFSLGVLSAGFSDMVSGQYNGPSCKCKQAYKFEPRLKQYADSLPVAQTLRWWLGVYQFLLRGFQGSRVSGQFLGQKNEDYLGRFFGDFHKGKV